MMIRFNTGMPQLGVEFIQGLVLTHGIGHFFRRPIANCAANPNSTANSDSHHAQCRQVANRQSSTNGSTTQALT
ncbi:hypothetical protein IQ266_09160 [filamentous cyanobacterium LEGE 11480]|uniref:Uncharacterized protein n=1 Tax=Romeriopsis navalis LEGE 11480 TaxID=2777977 RepID=A0A928VPS8_9CYAN|nr:hypothetical protein [Romeriopsis navalis]MBE9029894.1 hypothetical protein [Romeriopsis navalis LEGE 11480]